MGQSLTDDELKVGQSLFRLHSLLVLAPSRRFDLLHGRVGKPSLLRRAGVPLDFLKRLMAGHFAMISCGVAPCSARRLAIALRSPCALQCRSPA